MPDTVDEQFELVDLPVAVKTVAEAEHRSRLAHREGRGEVFGVLELDPQIGISSRFRAALQTPNGSHER